jgi:hypothetical protein
MPQYGVALCRYPGYPVQQPAGAPSASVALPERVRCQTALGLSCDQPRNAADVDIIDDITDVTQPAPDAELGRSASRVQRQGPLTNCDASEHKQSQYTAAPGNVAIRGEDTTSRAREAVDNHGPHDEQIEHHSCGACVAVDTAGAPVWLPLNHKLNTDGRHGRRVTHAVSRHWSKGTKR